MNGPAPVSYPRRGSPNLFVLINGGAAGLFFLLFSFRLPRWRCGSYFGLGITPGVLEIDGYESLDHLPFKPGENVLGNLQQRLFIDSLVPVLDTLLLFGLFNIFFDALLRHDAVVRGG